MAGVISYFSFSGRANRKRYWLTALALCGLLAVAGLVLGLLAGIPTIGIVFGVLLFASLAAWFVALLANSARRLHDRGKSAWWLLLFSGLPGLLSGLGSLISIGASEDVVAVGSLVSVLGLPFSIWGLVVIGFLKGTVGPNKYGDDLLYEPALAEVLV